MSNVPNEPGICRVCGSNDIDYGDMDIDGDSVAYDWTCEECNSDGIEYYSLTFVSNDVTHTGRIENKQ